MRFGAFMAPFHPAGQNPTPAFERNLELAVLRDGHRCGGIELEQPWHAIEELEVAPYCGFVDTRPVADSATVVAQPEGQR